MFFNMLKRLAVYFLAFAITTGLVLQVAGSALAGAGQPAMSMAAMDMGNGCNQPAPPCKGMTPDCIDSMGCLVSSVVPVAPLAASLPFQWGAVSYFSLFAVLTGVSIKPEHSPPILYA
jgi:hypothetical protein